MAAGSVCPKVLHMNPWNATFSAKYCSCGSICQIDSTRNVLWGKFNNLFIAFHLPNRSKAGLDAESTEKVKFFKLPTYYFFSFLHNLSESERESDLRKKNGGSPTISESKLQAKLTQWLPALYALKKFSQRAHSMNDMNYLRSKDAQKQLARTSLGARLRLQRIGWPSQGDVRFIGSLVNENGLKTAKTNTHVPF